MMGCEDGMHGCAQSAVAGGCVCMLHSPLERCPVCSDCEARKQAGKSYDTLCLGGSGWLWNAHPALLYQHACAAIIRRSYLIALAQRRVESRGHQLQLCLDQQLWHGKPEEKLFPVNGWTAGT